MDNCFRYCMRSTVSKINRFSAMLVYPLVSLIVMLLGIHLLCCIVVKEMPQPSLLVHAVYVCICLSTAIFLFYLGKIILTFESRKFNVTVDGIEIQGFEDSFFSWNDVHEIAVMYFGATASRDRYYTVICCFLKQPEIGFQKKMLNYLYGVKNTKNTVIIEYSDSIMAEILAKYPREILDYRTVQLK